MFTPNILAKVIIETLTGKETCDTKIININHKSLTSKGDLSFHNSVNHWRDYIDKNNEDLFKNSRSILQFFNLHQNSSSKESNDEQILNELIKLVTEKLSQICNLQRLDILFSAIIINNFVLINLVRSEASYNFIRAAIDENFYFGKKEFACRNVLSLKVDYTEDSEITNKRLDLFRDVTTNLLNFQGFKIQKENCNVNYVFTVKSKSKINDNASRIICGTVLGTDKKKETILTEQVYLENKIAQVRELNAERYLDIDENKDSLEKNMRKISNASINYELLSLKHTSTVILKNSISLDNSTKEASFILYNNARINAILDKYTKLVLDNQLPKIVPIEQIKSFNSITTDEDSWGIIYNYIIKYPDILSAAIKIEPKLEINIHLLWLFVSNLCHDFSRYYRKNRILMKSIDSNDRVVVMVTERIHMLRAIKVILKNLLLLLNVEEVTSM